MSGPRMSKTNMEFAWEKNKGLLAPHLVKVEIGSGHRLEPQIAAEEKPSAATLATMF